MTKSERLKPVVKIADSKERDAAKLLGECQRMLHQREARLEELLGYRQEYQQRFQEEGTKGFNVSTMQDFRSFIHKLDIAIGQQRALIESAIHDYEMRKQHWRATRSRSQAVGNVVDRYRQQEQKDRDRQEQRESDDRSQRNYIDPD